MAVPSRITERIQKLEDVRKNVEERKRADRGDLARRLSVAADRNARRQLLLDLAKDIFGWRDAFAASPAGRKFWNLIGSGARMLIFADWFWNGLPILAGNPVGAHVRISLDGPHHHFLVEEWRNGEDGRPEPYHEVCRLKSPLEMLEHPMVHPLLIEGLQTHVSGPEVWQMIEDELDRQLARYVNR